MPIFPILATLNINSFGCVIRVVLSKTGQTKIYAADTLAIHTLEISISRSFRICNKIHIIGITAIPHKTSSIHTEYLNNQ